MFSERGGKRDRSAAARTRMRRVMGVLWRRWTHVHAYGRWQRAEGRRMRGGEIVFYDLQIRTCLDCGYCKIKKVRW